MARGALHSLPILWSRTSRQRVSSLKTRLRVNVTSKSAVSSRQAGRTGRPGAAMMPAGAWQAAHAAAGPVPVVCTVSPGFVWEGFELPDPNSGTARELQRRGVVKP